MKRLLSIATLLVSLLAIPAAQARDVTIFESCADGRGQTIQAYADEQQAELVRIAPDEQGKASIHYNPAVLPRLSFVARIFLYSHTCARHGLPSGKSAQALAVARSADCMAISGLLADSAVDRTDLPTLQSELTFTDAEWKLLPGPKRDFELTTCRQLSGDTLKIPMADMPSAQQTVWNGCERACADRLWTCQKGCGRADCNSCLDTHRQCRNNCGGKAAEK